jgi:hypothetical protein
MLRVWIKVKFKASCKDVVMCPIRNRINTWLKAMLMCRFGLGVGFDLRFNS